MEARASMAVGSRVTIEGDLPDELLAELRAMHLHPNPDRQRTKAFNRWQAERMPEFIATYRELPGGIELPRGSLAKARSFLARNHCSVRVDDRRCLGDESMRGAIPDHRKTLFPFQARAMGEMMPRENAMLRSPTGSGKTTILLALAAWANLPTLVVVWNENLFNLWMERIVEELGVEERWVGVIGDGKRRFGPITIGMQQSLWRCADDVAPAFGMLLVDEMQRVPGRTLLSVVDRMPAKYRFAASDDERRADGKEFLTRDMFGEDPVEVKYEDLVRDGFILDVGFRMVPTDWELPWWGQTPDLEKLKLYNGMLDELWRDDARNRQCVDLVGRLVKEGDQVLVMSHRREHVQLLDHMLVAAGVRSGFVLGGKADSIESARTIREFKAGRLRAAVGTFQSVGVGVDLPKVGAGVFATPVLNNEKGRPQFKQFRGRFCRTAKGKADALVYYLWDQNVFGARPLRHACRWSKRVEVEWRGGIRPGREVLKEIEK